MRERWVSTVRGLRNRRSAMAGLVRPLATRAAISRSRGDSTASSSDAASRERPAAPLLGRTPAPVAGPAPGPATAPATGPAPGPTTAPATGPAPGPATAPATGPAPGPATASATGLAPGPGTAPA